MLLRWTFLSAALCLLCSDRVDAQGGPPYFTNDPETPGDRRWEINLGVIPLVSLGESSTRMPDSDVNYGWGERVQLTFEVAWLREAGNFGPTQYGLSQDALGVKWRFYDNGHGFSVSTFPQALINNPTSSVEHGLVPPGASFVLPAEFSKEIGGLAVNGEAGYSLVRGPDGWLAGVVVGHERHVGSKKKSLEVAVEFYASGDVNGAPTQQTLEAGLRYQLQRTAPVVLLAMAGRSVQHTAGSFTMYLGLQFLFGPASSNPH